MPSWPRRRCLGGVAVGLDLKVFLMGFNEHGWDINFEWYSDLIVLDGNFQEFLFHGFSCVLRCFNGFSTWTLCIRSPCAMFVSRRFDGLTT